MTGHLAAGGGSLLPGGDLGEDRHKCRREGAPDQQVIDHRRDATGSAERRGGDRRAEQRRHHLLLPVQGFVGLPRDVVQVLPCAERHVSEDRSLRVSHRADHLVGPLDLQRLVQHCLIVRHHLRVPALHRLRVGEMMGGVAERALVRRLVLLRLGQRGRRRRLRGLIGGEMRLRGMQRVGR